MRLAYDFHIHTAASPCGDNTMTPNNIVNMSLLKELDAIAITDHNTWANVKAVMDVAKNTSLVILPGMEVETSEEFHALVLFESLDQLITIGEIVSQRLPRIKNRKDIFGDQLIYNREDEVIGEIDQLLLTATSISIYELTKLVKDLGGVCYPAHIDRPSNSIISSLGAIPPDLDIQNIEVSRQVKASNFQLTYPKLRVIQSSDAHYLEDILERKSYMTVKKNTAKNWIEKLKTNKGQ